ncbi:hypothetical protein Tco_0646967, partial [Tanacetum coccineum]
EMFGKMAQKTLQLVFIVCSGSPLCDGRSPKVVSHVPHPTLLLAYISPTTPDELVLALLLLLRRGLMLLIKLL